ncbi:uncharacterized protein ACJ7VT_008176 [Polymixia lowei]
MALSELKSWRLSLARALVCSLLLFLCLQTSTGMSGWGRCFDGQDVFATIRENSLRGELIAALITDTTEEGVRWSLSGKDADWFSLDGRNLRLNTSPEKVLDREVLGPILMAELACHEEETLQSVYRIMVEILNENDNSPVFAGNTVQSLIISELIPVNTVVFTVQATDADNDNIIYSIDQTSPDAGYFKIDLPSSGEVILSKPLDYETKTLLAITIHASEMSTAERFSTNTTISITVLDGDDQYPQFLPCTLLFQDESSRICTNPVYTVNVTEGEEDVVLDFSPGPIHAVDGDSGLSSPIRYAILSGADDGRFLMDRETGQVRLTRGVTDRLATPTLHLWVTAYQDDDPRKYTVTTALVHVLAVNRFLPEFDMTQYNGFVVEGKSPASLINTYGNKLLMLRVQDRDFMHGFNPMIYFRFSPTSNHTDFYQVTQEGLIIARTNELKPKQRHILEVSAVDQESGDATYAVIVVEVLPLGQAIPRSPLREELLTSCNVGKALVLCFLFMIILGCILYLMSWLTRRYKWKKDPLERGCVAQGKHPNVSLRWFQLMSHRGPMQQMDEVDFNHEELGTYNPTFTLQEKPAVSVRKDPPPCQGCALPSAAAAPDTAFIPAETVCSSVLLNNDFSTPIKCCSASPVTQPIVVDVSRSDMAQNAAPPVENVGSPTPPPDTAPDSVEDSTGLEPPSADPGLVSTDVQSAPPVAPPDSPSTPPDVSPDGVDPFINPSSPPSSPTAACSEPPVASAEVDTPYHTPGVDTPPQEEAESLPYLKQTGTPPPTLEHAPLKARSPHAAPPATPEQTPVALSSGEPGQVDLPSTSTDQAHTSGHPEGADGPICLYQKRRSSTNSGNAQGSSGEADDAGCPGDEDADKNSEGDSDLEPDEEELLRVLARLHPVFITITK